MNICYLHGKYISYHRSALGNIKALRTAGVRVVAEPRWADAVILHDDAMAFPGYFARYPELRSRLVIGYCVWELDRLPEPRQQCLAFVDEVWTPSAFSCEILAAYHPQVHRVPHLVERLRSDARAVRALANRIAYDPAKLYFYTIANCRDPRKNTAAALAAFDALHQRHPDQVKLVVKQHSQVDSTIAGRPGVVSIEEPLPDDLILALHELCHVYVSPHRAEAWGMGLAEAMAHGNPVVATAYSGNMDFMSELDGYLVPFSLRAITKQEAEFASRHCEEEARWADIDPEALLDAMDAAFASRGRDDRAWRATAIAARYGIESLTACIRGRLQALNTAGANDASRGAMRRSVKLRRPRVCIFHNPPKQGRLILGRERAADALARAYLKFGRNCHYSLVAHRNRVSSLCEELSLPTSHAEVIARESVDAIVQSDSVNIWHDIQLDTYAPFLLRSRAPSPFPVSIVHHTISYNHLLHGSWLQLLLAQTYPFDSIICTSRAAKKALRQLLDGVARRFNAVHGTALSFDARMPVIPLGVDLNRFRPRPAAPARTALGLDPDAFVMLWVGRLSAVDKADLLPLLRVCRELRQRFPWKGVTLLCCGSERPEHAFSGSLQDYAARLELGDGFRLITDKPGGSEQLYAAADVFVSPADSLQESFGLAVIEAMASGVPQVVSDWNGYRDTVVDGETGFTVPTYWSRVDEDMLAMASWVHWQENHMLLSQSVAVDTRAMLDALVRLVDDEPLRLRMAEASRRRAEQHYGLETIVRAHEQLWTEQLQQVAGRPVSRRRGLDYSLPRYCEVFAHYPTRMLEDDAGFALTRWGRQVAARNDDVPMHHADHWRHLSRDAIATLIGEFLVAYEAGHPLRMGDVIEQSRARAILGKQPAALRRHLLWMLKVGLIELAP